MGPSGERIPIPGTLLISALGIIPDVHQAVTMDLKKDGDIVFLVGETHHEMAGSHFALVQSKLAGQDSASLTVVVLTGGRATALGQAPGLPPQALAHYRALHRAMRRDWCVPATT